jgi:uncharacterized damage-inducible protein DinB
MQMQELFLAELEREIPLTRRALERVPEGRNDWKPHPKSVSLGYLAALVASLPSWVGMTINQEQLDFTPDNNSKYRTRERASRQELLKVFEDSIIEAREALSRTSDEHLLKPWRFLVGGKLVSEQPRHIVLRDSVFNHLAHHRGQLTVYLRLTDAPVPAIYGPSADEGRFP